MVITKRRRRLRTCGICASTARSHWQMPASTAAAECLTSRRRFVIILLQLKQCFYYFSSPLRRRSAMYKLHGPSFADWNIGPPTPEDLAPVAHLTDVFQFAEATKKARAKFSTGGSVYRGVSFHKCDFFFVVLGRCLVSNGFRSVEKRMSALADFNALVAVINRITSRSQAAGKVQCSNTLRCEKKKPWLLLQRGGGRPRIRQVRGALPLVLHHARTSSAI